MKALWGITSSLLLFFSFLRPAPKDGTITIISSTPSEIYLEITCPPLQLRGGNIHTLQMGTLETIIREGAPAYPFLSGIVAIDELGEFGASVEHQETYDISLQSEPLAVGQYPPQQLTLDEPQILRDFRIARFMYIPIQYIPETNALRVTSRATVRIRKTAPQGSNEKHHCRQKISRAFAPLYEHTILNYDAFKRFSSDTILLLIITPDTYYNDVLPYAEWKERTGILTRVVQFSEISSNPTYAQIREYIYTIYSTAEHPPDYFLAIGDAGIFPIRYTYDYSGYPGSYANDNYYVCMDSPTEIFPDIFGARLPIQNALQIETMLAKIVNYEEHPYTYDPFWLRNALMVADNQFPSQAQTKHRVRERLLNYGYGRVDSIYAKNYSSSYAIGVAITNAINEGRGIVNYRGRGWSSGWYGGIGSIFNISQVAALNNGRMLPVVTSVGCGVAKFDEYNCYGEQWLRNGTPTNEKGAVSFFGPTWNTHTRHNNKLDTGIYRGLLQEGLTTFGEVTMRGKYHMYDICGDGDTTDTQMNEYLILGDPTLLIRTGNPQPMNVIHPSAVPLGYSELLVSVSDLYGPVARALVCAKMDSSFHVSRHTDSAGIVLLPITPSMIDTITISAIAQNHYLYEGMCVVQDTGCLIVYREHTIDDDSMGTSAGNGNGIPNPAEHIEIPVLIANKGDQPATGVIATLRSEDMYITITDSIETLGVLAAGDSVLTPDDFDISLSPSIPDAHPALFELILQDSANAQWQWNFIVKAQTPIIELARHRIDDAGQPSPNAILDPGEQVELSCWLRNSGSTVGTGVAATIRSENPYILCSDSTSSYGDINPLEEKAGDTFTISADSLTPIGFEAEMKLVFTTYDGYKDSTTFSITVGMGTDFLIWDLDQNHNSAPEIRIALEANGYRGIYDTDIENYLHILDSFKAIFICVGINPHNYVLEDGPAIDSLCGYLNGGGRMYMEGGDTWCYDIPTALHSYFRIPEEYDGFNDAQSIYGQYSTFTYQMSFVYAGENHWMDRLATYGGSFSIFRNSSPYYINGIAYSGSYRTVGLAFEFGGLQDATPPSTKAILADSIMHFFGIMGIEEEPATERLPEVFALLPPLPNPCRNEALIRFQVPRKSRVSLRIFDLSGRIVAVLIDGMVEPGYHTAQLKTKTLSSGVYFYRLEGVNTTFTKKMVVVK